MAEDVKRPEKVSKSDGANEAVELLRQAARAIVRLGDAFEDALEKAEMDLSEARARCTSFEEEIMHMNAFEDEHERWGELLDDFKRGIRDRDELLAETVGP